MSEFKYEIGDEFRGPWGWYCKVEHRTRSVDNANWYWCLNEDGEPTTYYQESLDGWTKIEPRQAGEEILRNRSN